MNLTFIDNAFPLASYPKADGFAFYIGGDTPHVWTNAEVAALPYRYRLPIFVRSNPQDANANLDAAVCLAQLGLHGAPKGVLVALDFETAIDPGYVAQFCTIVATAGYPVILYGSESFVHRNNMPDGLYWGADWTKVNHIHPGDSATQWISLTAFDESSFAPTLPLWDTQPHAAVGKTAIPVTLDGPWKEGDTGNRVRAIQALAGPRRGHVDVVVDGVFGPSTTAIVKGVQAAMGITVDGIVGPDTWKALLD